MPAAVAAAGGAAKAGCCKGWAAAPATAGVAARAAWSEGKPSAYKE